MRQIRAMLHAWEKYGYEAAQEYFLSRFDVKHRTTKRNRRLFVQVVKGRIDFLGMIRGKENPIYLRFLEQLQTLDPEMASPVETSQPQVTISTTSQSRLQLATGGERDDQQEHVDIYARYRIGLDLLKEKLLEKRKRVGEKGLPDYDEALREQLDQALSDVLLFEMGMVDNIGEAKKHGENEGTRSRRSVLVENLNEIGMAHLNVSYTGLCNENQP